MRLIDADALREQWNVSERCEDCKQDARYCDGNLYGSTLYSLRDICGSIDDAPIIDAIPVEWLREKMKIPTMTCANPFDYVFCEWMNEQEAQDEKAK